MERYEYLLFKRMLIVITSACELISFCCVLRSTSERNKIQASFETAALLREAGKGKWLVPRDKLIFAKGKGEMQTYWVYPKSGGTRSSNGSCSSEGNNSSHFNDKCNDPSLTERIPSNSTGRLLDPKLQRAADWTAEILLRLLKQMVARRMATGRTGMGKTNSSLRAAAQEMSPHTGKQVLDEVHDVIYLPKYDAQAAKKSVDVESVMLPPKVSDQLHDFVNVIASMYRGKKNSGTGILGIRILARCRFLTHFFL